MSAVHALYIPPDVTPAGELLDLLTRRPAWHADAACREHPELSWFTERGETLRAQRTVCAGCLVRQECLDFALAQPSQNDLGVWGGLSMKERLALRRRAPRPGPALPKAVPA